MEKFLKWFSLSVAAFAVVLIPAAAYLDSRPVDDSGFKKCIAEKRDTCCSPTGECSRWVVSGLEYTERRGAISYSCKFDTGKCVEDNGRPNDIQRYEIQMQHDREDWEAIKAFFRNIKKRLS